MPSTIAANDEFLVNTTTTNIQDEGQLAGLADGRFVAVWSDNSATGGDTSSSAIRGQIFNADGSPSGAEFLINTVNTASSQYSPAVSATADGGFVVVWSDLSGTSADTSDSGVQLRAYDADGVPLADESLANISTSNTQGSADIAILADGGYAVTWTDNSTLVDDPFGFGVVVALFNEDGSRRGGEIQANSTFGGDQWLSQICALDDGRAVVTWFDDSATGGDTSSHAVRARIINADGSFDSDEFLVNTHTNSSQSYPDVTALEGGRFAIVWEDASLLHTDDNTPSLRGQIFNPDGSMYGSEFLVNTTTGATQSVVALATLADGRFIAVYEDASQSADDPDGRAIRAQIYNPDGSRSGDEFLVNQSTTASQTTPTVTSLADGRIVIGWTDNSGALDSSTSGTVARIFDPRDTSVNLEGSMLDDEFVGTRWGDRLNGFDGDDRLSGGYGDDRIEGEAGDDILAGDAGRDRIVGGSGDDEIDGGFGHDRLIGGGGNDLIDGGFGLDYMNGGSGNDIYVVDRLGDRVVETASGGTDTLSSAALNLSLNRYNNLENIELLGDRDLRAFGDSGNNRITGNEGDNFLSGGNGRDTLNGDLGADTLRGGDGRDVLRGGGGADSLRGDGGRDVLFGGSDADTFVFRAESDSSGANIDRIADFEHGTDVIDVSAIDARTGAGNQAFDFISGGAFSGSKGELRVEHVGNRTYVQADRDGDGETDFEILLSGNITLDVGDFIL